jgi:histidine ammonia-lyase
LTETLIPGQVSLAQLERIFRGKLPARLHDSTRHGITRAASHIAAAASGTTAVYGVNTGFGKLANVKIAPEDTATLQKNLILSHSCGVGAPMPEDVVRLMMVLKLLSLGRGASGVRTGVVDLIEAMLLQNVIPVIPDQGSVGASGDLAPLAHMTAVMIGHGEAIVDGQMKSGAEALAKKGLSPITLGAK